MTGQDRDRERWRLDGRIDGERQPKKESQHEATERHGETKKKRERERLPLLPYFPRKHCSSAQKDMRQQGPWVQRKGCTLLEQHQRSCTNSSKAGLTEACF